jgi:hypothetical protein
VVDQSRMAGLRREQRHHDMQNMAKMMMMMTFVKIGVMKLKTGLTYMNIQKNKILHLNCVNFFCSSKKWVGPVKVLPLLDQISSEVQGTFGMTENTNMTGHFTKRGGLSYKTLTWLAISLREEACPIKH